VPNGALRCAADGTCPDGYHCAGDNSCWLDGEEPDLGALMDGSVDAGRDGAVDALIDQATDDALDGAPDQSMPDQSSIDLAGPADGAQSG
jgi:hypothetical protein